MTQQNAFAERLIVWQLNKGRRGLPWMVTDPYRRWLSEVMLQQTQVSVVKEYFLRFIDRFPTLESLAAAPLEDVMQLWQGLGYYSRARNLHACAKKIVQDHHGEFPQSVQALSSLPGIGRSTAAAIASFSFEASEPILDGNVKRIFSRQLCLTETIDSAQGEKKLWDHAEKMVAQQRTGVYNQALMDVGSMICTRTKPRCDQCPVAEFCCAFKLGTQQEYPHRRTKKARPTKEVVMIAYCADHCLWLVEREQKGVWQGLLSLPEEDRGHGQFLTRFEHDFSHYHLVADVFIETDLTRLSAQSHQTGRWVTRDQFSTVALAAPVRRVLETFVW